MKKTLLLALLIQVSAGQSIFETFDLSGANRYLGITRYEFEVPPNDTLERVLEIQGVKGDISLAGGPGLTIILTEKMTVWSSSEKKARSRFEDYRAQVSRSASAGIIEVSGARSWPPKTSFSYVISLPASFNVQARTQGGDITLREISGETFLKTSGGDLEISSVSGKLTAKTSGGDVDLERSAGTLHLSTSGGDIEVRDFEGILDAHTSGGDVDVESGRGDVSVSTSGGDLTLVDIQGLRIEGRTSGGDIEVEQIKGELAVNTSGGDIEVEDLDGGLEATTSGGDIDLVAIRGPVDLATSGGDIRGQNMQGSIEAHTSAGTISIEKIWNRNLEDHSINLKSSFGDIELSLPDHFPATLDIVVTGSRSSGAIDSHFPITITSHENEVRGAARIGPGTFTIRLHTSQGTITIEKD